MTQTTFLDALGWVELVIVVLVTAGTILYVVSTLVIAAARAGSISRAAGLIAAVAAFLLAWSILIFVAFLVFMMAAVSDAQESPGGDEKWRHLTALAGTAVVMAAAGWGAVWVARRLSAGTSRSGIQ